MKLRTFKKVIHRKKFFKHYPRYMNNIMILCREDFVYYTCHKLRAMLCLDTDKVVYMFKRKEVGKEQGL